MFDDRYQVFLSLTVGSESVSGSRVGAEVTVTEGRALKRHAAVHGKSNWQAVWGRRGLPCQGQHGVLTWSLRRDGAEKGQLLSWGHVVSRPFGRVIRLRENLLPPRRLWLWSESLTSRLLFSHWATCVTLRPSGLQHTGSSVLHYPLEFAQIPVHWIGNAVYPSHPLPLSSFAFSLSQHPGFFQWDSSSHQVAKVLELRASVHPVNIQGWPLYCSSKCQLLKCNNWVITCLGMYIIKPVSGREFWEGMDTWKDWKTGSCMKELASLFCSLKTYTGADMSSRLIWAVNPTSFIAKRPQEHIYHLLNNNISISLAKLPQT